MAEDVHASGWRASTTTPEAVIATWKAHFATFWPKGQRFYAPLSGIAPGRGRPARDRSRVPGAPVRLSTGVLVLYADDESFTFMTPEGHTLSAWITFSAWRDGDVDVAQAQALERPSDPFDELAYMLGGNRPEQPVLAGDAAQPRDVGRRRDAGRWTVQVVCIDRQPPVALLAQRPQQRHDPLGTPDADRAGAQADRSELTPGGRPGR